MWFTFLKIVFHFFYCCTARLAGSQFPDHGLNPGPGSESTESYPLDCQRIPEMVHILEGWLQKDFVQNCFSIRYYLLLSSENFIHWQIHSLFNLINELVETKLERSLNFIHLPHSFSLKISGIGSPLMSATLQWMSYHPFQ